MPWYERQVRHFSGAQISAKESKSPSPLEVKVQVETARQNRNLVPTVKINEELIIAILRMHKRIGLQVLLT